MVLTFSLFLTMTVVMVGEIQPDICKYLLRFGQHKILVCYCLFLIDLFLIWLPLYIVGEWPNNKRTDLLSYNIIRPLVDTFRMYLCANTDTFPQNVSVPIQIHYQKMYLYADTDTFSDTFWLIFDQNILHFNLYN